MTIAIRTPQQARRSTAGQRQRNRKEALNVGMATTPVPPGTARARRQRIAGSAALPQPPIEDRCCNGYDVSFGYDVSREIILP